MSDGKIRVGVVGVGHFGRIHAAKYAQDPQADLIAVADADTERGGAVAEQHDARALTDYHDLAGQVDAVSIAVPTSAHYDVARFFLENGIHVLIEKPITTDVAQAEALIALAKEKGLVLQVGHLVRFFAKDTGLMDAVSQPLFIDVDRITPYAPRVSDVSVVLDLMIHDIDLIMVLVQSPVVRVDAVGSRVLSNFEDIVNARIQFENGCVANLTASRVAFKSERRMRIFQPNSVISVDTLKGSVIEIRKPEGMTAITGADLQSSGFEFNKQVLSEHDALQAEISAFLGSVASGSAPVVSGEDGKAALEIAQQIIASVKAQSEIVKAHHKPA